MFRDGRVHAHGDNRPCIQVQFAEGTNGAFGKPGLDGNRHLQIINRICLSKTSKLERQNNLCVHDLPTNTSHQPTELNKVQTAGGRIRKHEGPLTTCARPRARHLDALAICKWSTRALPPDSSLGKSDEVSCLAPLFRCAALPISMRSSMLKCCRIAFPLAKASQRAWRHCGPA